MGKLKKYLKTKLRNAVGTPEIEQNIAEIERDLTDLQNAAGTLDQNLAAANGKLDVSQRKAEDIHRDLTQAHEKIDELRQETHDVRTDLTQAHEKINELRQETHGIRTDLTQAHEKIDALQREQGEVHADLTQAHEKIDAFRREMGDVHADLTQAHEKIDAFQREQGEVHADLTQAHEKIDAFRQEMGDVHADLTQAHEKIDALQREQGEVHADLTQAHEKIDELRQETHGIRTDLTQAHEKIDALQREQGEIHVDIARAHEKIDALKVGMSENGRNIVELRDEVTALRRREEDIRVELVRNQILNRWKTVDALDSVIFPPDSTVSCRICGHSAPKKSYETRLSYCIFNGGKLERFVCPECGCIFGPMKMFALNPGELAAEYTQHYSYYQEGDSHESELLAFAEVEQGKKDKVYLNYGAGVWSKTSEILRRRGYTVYDYEPFAAQGVVCDYLITSPEEVGKMKFDGIFSNDLIEHLTYPLDELKFMRGLLKNRNSRMAHATGCFDYAYEYTRFHYFFYTGKSLQIMAEKIGMNVMTVSRPSPTNTHFKVGIFSFEQEEK